MVGGSLKQRVWEHSPPEAIYIYSDMHGVFYFVKYRNAMHLYIYCKI